MYVYIVSGKCVQIVVLLTMSYLSSRGTQIPPICDPCPFGLTFTVCPWTYEVVKDSVFNCFFLYCMMASPHPSSTHTPTLTNIKSSLWVLATFHLNWITHSHQHTHTNSLEMTSINRSRLFSFKLNVRSGYWCGCWSYQQHRGYIRKHDIWKNNILMLFGDLAVCLYSFNLFKHI